MPDPIELLKQEHRLIERVLEALEGWAGQVKANVPGCQEDGARFVTFIREFADALHHGKEELILFRAMVGNEYAEQAKLVAVMLHEHVVGRSHVAVLADAAALNEFWSKDKREAVASASLSFCGLLRQHINREDTYLYAMAATDLPAAELAAISEACEAFENVPGRRERARGLRQLAYELHERYGAPIE